MIFRTICLGSAAVFLAAVAAVAIWPETSKETIRGFCGTVVPPLMCASLFLGFAGFVASQFSPDKGDWGDRVGDLGWLIGQSLFFVVGLIVIAALAVIGLGSLIRIVVLWLGGVVD